MSRYVDSVVVLVPTENLDEYREMAANAGEVWIKHGALQYFEGVEDEGAPDKQGNSMRRFADLTDSEEDESVVVAFMIFESQEHRDEVTAAVQNDPEYQEQFQGEMPFDPSRMTMGSFDSIVNYEA